MSTRISRLQTGESLNRAAICALIAVLAFATTFGTTSLSAQDSCRSDSAHVIPITGYTGSVQNPCFSPASDLLAVTNFEKRYNVGTGIVFTAHATGGKRIRVLSPTDAQSVNLPGQCWSGASSLVTYSSDVVARDEIYTVPSSGGKPRRITNRPGHRSFEPSLSPVFSDGSQWIVFESHVSHGKHLKPGEIWKVRTDGKGLARLTEGWDDRQPEWSPAGDRIVFQRRMGPNKWDVFTIHTDGSHPKNITHHPQLVNTDPSWSPSGKYIVYSAGGRGIKIANLFIISAAGGKPTRLTRSCGYDGAPGWSPDGKRIAFESAPYDPDQHGNTRIWVIDAPEGVQ